MDRRPPPAPPAWWMRAGISAVLGSVVVLAILVWTDAPSLFALAVLVFAWGLIGIVINGRGLNRLRRATLYQVTAGLVLVILGMWLGADGTATGETGNTVTFGLLIYPGSALALNPVVVRVAETLRARY